MENEEQKVENVETEEVAVVEVKSRKKLSKKVLAIGGGILAALAIGAAFILTKDKDDSKIIEPDFIDVTDIPTSTDTSSETTEVE